MDSNRAVRSAGAFAISGLIFAAGCGHMPMPSLPAATSSQNVTYDLPPVASERFLYSVASNAKVYSYTLPIASGEKPSAILNVLGGGLAATPRDLYVTLNHGTEIAKYATPIVTGEQRSATIAITNDNVLIFGGGYLYVGDGGSGNRANHVAAYAVPLRRGEQPSAVITFGSALMDFPGALALDSKFLYVVVNDSVSSYVLPLKTGEHPSVTIRGFNSARGLAVSGNHLYVSSYNLSSVYVYALPLKASEKPEVTLVTEFSWAGPMTADSGNLYVSDSAAYAWVYPLPIQAGESPVANVSDANTPAQTLSISP